MPDKIFPYGRGAMLFLLLLAPTLFLSANDWLHALCAELILVLIGLLWLAIAKRLQVRDLWTLIGRAPHRIKQTLYSVLMLCSAIYAAYTAWRSAYFLSQTALKLWSVWLAALGLLIVCWLIAKQGAPALFLWAIPTAWAVGLTAILSLALSLPDWQMPDFRGTFLLSNILRQTLDGIPILIAFLLFTGFDSELPQERAIVFGGIFAAILTGLTVFRANAVLGANCARVLTYPAYAAAGVFQIGALARSEILFGGIFFLCLVARIALSIAVLQTAYAALRKKTGR